MTSSPTGTSLQTVSTALLGVTGTALGDCGVITSTRGVTASICSMASTTSPLKLDKVPTSVVCRSLKDKLSDDTILSGTENCKKDRKKLTNDNYFVKGRGTGKNNMFAKTRP